MRVIRELGAYFVEIFGFDEYFDAQHTHIGYLGVLLSDGASLESENAFGKRNLIAKTSSTLE